MPVTVGNKGRIGHFVDRGKMIDVYALWSGGVNILITNEFNNTHELSMTWETVQNLQLVLEKHITEVKDADYASDAYTS